MKLKIDKINQTNKYIADSNFYSIVLMETISEANPSDIQHYNITTHYIPIIGSIMSSARICSHLHLTNLNWRLIWCLVNNNFLFMFLALWRANKQIVTCRLDLTRSIESL